jgi:hypothetical protein
MKARNIATINANVKFENDIWVNNILMDANNKNIKLNIRGNLK